MSACPRPSPARGGTRLVDEGRLAPRVDPRRFDLHSAERAYEALLDGSARGKIVVDVDAAIAG